jgi:hypothetical protein
LSANPSEPVSAPVQVRWIALLVIALGCAAAWYFQRPASKQEGQASTDRKLTYKPRLPLDDTGFTIAITSAPPWPKDASLERIAQAWKGLDQRLIAQADERLRSGSLPHEERIRNLLMKAAMLNFRGEAPKAAAVLDEARNVATSNPVAAEDWLYTIVYFQGVTELRRGEDENCIQCRGESSCILPLAPAAVHTNPAGSRKAIHYFQEYLAEFPDDLAVRWLLNVAHMTLGEHPSGVEPRFLITLDKFNSPEHGIGKFRDVGQLVGIARLDQGGGAILDDFDNDDRPDLIITSWDATRPAAFYRNTGAGTFEDRSTESGIAAQLGGLYCVQTDYNNDGLLDVFIARGAWFTTPMRPSLLRNNGGGTFTDATAEAGLLAPANSISAQWADFDNDGHLDLFVCNETGPCRLYRNLGNGSFREVAAAAGVAGSKSSGWKGCAWLDYDADGDPDLFVNNLEHTAVLYRNNGDGTFSDVTEAMGIRGPEFGFSCWAWDYDNDGWTDIFATCYQRTTEGVVKGLLGMPHSLKKNKLYRNLEGKGFVDVAEEAGLDGCYETMGSNFGDFDNDGFLDIYLGTGEPSIAALVPNRLFRNLGGRKFADISSSSGTGHLQKGHGVGCGDWDRNGTVDIAIQMGGATPGDRYHNVLFQNPGQENRWLNVKLVGKKTNRAAIGARIKAVTAGPNPRTIHRHISSGSSFGGNPLEQMIGLGRAERIDLLEVYWPTSKTTQTFRNLDANQAIEITEFAETYRRREYRPISLPK